MLPPSSREHYLWLSSFRHPTPCTSLPPPFGSAMRFGRHLLRTDALASKQLRLCWI